MTAIFKTAFLNSGFYNIQSFNSILPQRIPDNNNMVLTSMYLEGLSIEIKEKQLLTLTRPYICVYSPGSLKDTELILRNYK